MTRLILMLLLVLSTAPAYAEWVRVSESAEATVYADPGTIRRNGNLVKMWNLYDFETIQTNADSSFLSSNGQGEYDCAEERRRGLAFAWFSGHMGHGKPVYSNSDEQKWRPISPGSIDQTLWKFACAKR